MARLPFRALLIALSLFLAYCPGPSGVAFGSESKREASPKPSGIPSSPWKLAHLALRAYQTHDEALLRSLICWDGADSLILDMTDRTIHDSMQAKIVSTSFDPLHGNDQEVAVEPRTYRYNLEHVGYLKAKIDEFHVWGFSVGRDLKGYRITLWAPSAETLLFKDWDRPPSPREWLDNNYHDESQRGFISYNFRDSVEMANYARDLLALALEDEQSGPSRWAALHLWNAEGKLQSVRNNILHQLRDLGRAAIPALRWSIFNETAYVNQMWAMNLLEGSRFPESDSLVVEILSRGHANAAIIEQALTISQERGLRLPQELLAPYLQHYRPSVVTRAQAVNKSLGYPEISSPGPARMLQLPVMKGILASLDSLFVAPFDSKTRFVAVHFFKHPSFSKQDVRGWLILENSTSKTVMTTEGRFQSIPWTKEFVANMKPTLTNINIKDEAVRIIKLSTMETPRPELGIPSRWEEPSPLNGPPHIHEAFLGYRLYKSHRNELAAKVLARALDSSYQDSDLTDGVESVMGQFHGARMFMAFAGDRDYASALREARLVASRFPRSNFGPYAAELARQLPLRMNDFKSMRLPTEAEWHEMQGKLNRGEQIRYLCDRLRLLSVSPDVEQYAEAPGIAAFVEGGEGKTPVINPALLLKPNPNASKDPLSSPGLQLTFADIPVLAPYLLERWYIPQAMVGRMGEVFDWTEVNPDMCLTETRYIVADVIRGLDPSALPPREKLKLMDLNELKAKVTALTERPPGGPGLDRRAQVLEVVNGAKDYSEIIPVMDYLVEHQVKEAIPKLLTFLNPGSPYAHLRYRLIEACRKIDSASCYPEVRKYLVDKDYLVRFNAGLIVYEAGDTVDGLMAMAFGLKNDLGCSLKSGDPIEPAVATLLSSKGSDELEIARMALNSHCFPTASPYEQWPVIRVFTEAHQPAGMEVFLKELADTSVTERQPVGDTTFAVQRREVVAKFILTKLMPPHDELGFKYGDPPEKRVRRVNAAKHWVTQQIADMKRVERN